MKKAYMKKIIVTTLILSSFTTLGHDNKVELRRYNQESWTSLKREKQLLEIEKLKLEIENLKTCKQK